MLVNSPSCFCVFTCSPCFSLQLSFPHTQPIVIMVPIPPAPVDFFLSCHRILKKYQHVLHISLTWLCVCVFFSTHVLTEDVVYREVTADHRLLSRRLLTKTNRLPRWAEKFFPSGMSRSVYIIEDSIVDPVTRSLTTYTWNLNHTTLMVRCRLMLLSLSSLPARQIFFLPAKNNK